MVSLAKVTIWKETVGIIAWDDARGYATFEFDRNYRKKGLELSPLMMPMNPSGPSRVFAFPQLNPDTYRGLPGMLADSLPDRFGNRLIRSWLARQGRSYESFNPVEQLCYIGHRGMGALEYEPSSGWEEKSSIPVEIEQLVVLAREVLAEREDITGTIPEDREQTDLTQIIEVGTSAGGARAKAIIAYDETSGEVRSGQLQGLDQFSYWIIKFDGVTNHMLGDPAGFGNIEYAYYLMAKACGINMMESRLLEEHGRAHFMTKRFDRQAQQKLHMQTLCGLAHFDYNDPNSYSYEQAFQVMRQLRLPYSDAEELFRRMCFNVIARNQDDHTKNTSFLMNKEGTWQLAPAYDVTFAYDPANRWMRAHQMSLNGKRQDIEREDLLTVARSMNIKKANQLIESVEDSISSWPDFAQDAGVSAEQITSIGKTFRLGI